MIWMIEKVRSLKYTQAITSTDVDGESYSAVGSRQRACRELGCTQNALNVCHNVSRVQISLTAPYSSC